MAENRTCVVQNIPSCKILRKLLMREKTATLLGASREKYLAVEVCSCFSDTNIEHTEIQSYLHNRKQIQKHS